LGIPRKNHTYNEMILGKGFGAYTCPTARKRPSIKPRPSALKTSLRVTRDPFRIKGKLLAISCNVSVIKTSLHEKAGEVIFDQESLLLPELC